MSASKKGITTKELKAASRYISLQGYSFYQRKNLPNQQGEFLKDAEGKAPAIKQIFSMHNRRNINSFVIALILKELEFRFETRQLGKSKADISHPNLYKGTEELLEALEAYEKHPENIRQIIIKTRQTLIGKKEFIKEYDQEWDWNAKGGYTPPAYIDQTVEGKEIKGRIILKNIFEALQEIKPQLKQLLKQKEQAKFKDIGDKSVKMIRSDIQKEFARILLNYLNDRKISIGKNKKAILLCQLLDLIDMIPPYDDIVTNYKSRKHYYRQYGKNILRTVLT